MVRGSLNSTTDTSQVETSVWFKGMLPNTDLRFNDNTAI